MFRQTALFFSRSHKIAPRGSKQGVFAALTHTEKNAVKNEILVM